MDISLKHEDYKYLNVSADNSVEESVECELYLPEYMPEILRIVKSSAVPKVNSCNLSGERVTADGVCDLRMVYTAEDGGIYSFSQSVPFTRHCENSCFTDAVDVNVKIAVSYVNCRATGTKRAGIKAGLNIKFYVYREEKEDIVSLGETKGIEQKNITVKAMSLGCKKTRSFSMSDTLTLNSPSAFIISTGACAVCTETRKINNKIMIKGEADIDICYVNANDKTSAEHIKHSITVNQILEFDGMQEHFTGSVILRVTSLDVIPKGESTGMATAFDISLGIDACVDMWEEKLLTVISDAYAVTNAVELKKTPRTFFTPLCELNETYLCENSFNITGEGVGEIADCVGEVTGIRTKTENGELSITGSLSVSLIIKDAAGSFSGVGKMFDFVFKKNIDTDSNNTVCMPEVVPVCLDYAVKNENTVDIKARLSVVGSVFGKITVEAVTDITESENAVKCNTNAITVYFPEQNGETLWSIARRYNTTVKAIAEENNLEGETTENLKMLFIPSA